MDLTKLSDDQLMAMLNASGDSAPAAAPDLSNYSEGELLSMLNKPVDKGAGSAWTALNSLMFNLGDEVGAGGNALIDRVVYGTPLKEGYEGWLNDNRNFQKQFEAENPGLALGANLGGAAVGVLGTGGLSLLRGASAATKTAQAVQTAQKAKTALQLAKEGAKAGAGYGALAGFGSAEGGIDERIAGTAGGGVIGAGAGSVLSPLISKGVSGVSKLDDYIGATDSIKKIFSPSVAAQRGAVRVGEDVAEEQVPKAAEAYLARKLRDLPPDDLARIQDELALAQREGSPVFLEDVANSKRLTQTAKGVLNRDESSDLANRALEERALGSNQRARDIARSGGLEPQAASDEATEAARYIEKDLRQLRKQEAKPIYDEARAKNPVFKSKEISQSLDNPYVQDAIQEAKRGLPHLRDLPDNHFDVLTEAKRVLYESTRDPNLKTTYKSYADRAYQNLKNALHEESSILKQADEVFGDKSKGLNVFEEGPLSAVSKIMRGEVEDVGSQILKASPPQLKEMMKLVPPGQRHKFKQAIRGSLEVEIRGTALENDPLKKFVSIPEMREKISLILGDDEAGDLLRKLERERKIFKAKQRLNPQSGTISNQEENKRISDASSTISRLFTSPRQLIAEFLDDKLFSPSEKLSRDMADILFSPQKSREAFGRIKPQIEDYWRKNAASEALGNRFAETLSPAASNAASQAASSSLGLGLLGMMGIDPMSDPANVKPPAPPMPGEIEDEMPQDDSFVVGGQANPSEMSAYLDALRQVESGGGKYLRSPAGALGPYQFMPAMAEAYGLEDPFDETTARDAARRLLEDEYSALKDPLLALAAYNAGRPAITRAIKKAGGARDFDQIAAYLPKETREYVPKILDEKMKENGWEDYRDHYVNKMGAKDGPGLKKDFESSWRFYKKTRQPNETYAQWTLRTEYNNLPQDVDPTVIARARKRIESEGV